MCPLKGLWPWLLFGLTFSVRLLSHGLPNQHKNGDVHSTKQNPNQIISSDATPKREQHAMEKTRRGRAKSVMAGDLLGRPFSAPAGVVQKRFQFSKALWPRDRRGTLSTTSTPLRSSSHRACSTSLLSQGPCWGWWPFPQMYNLPPLPGVPALFVLLSECSLRPACR